MFGKVLRCNIAKTLPKTEKGIIFVFHTCKHKFVRIFISPSAWIYAFNIDAFQRFVLCHYDFNKYTHIHAYFIPLYVQIYCTFYIHAHYDTLFTYLYIPFKKIHIYSTQFMHGCVYIHTYIHTLSQEKQYGVRRNGSKTRSRTATTHRSMIVLTSRDLFHPTNNTNHITNVIYLL